jgi:hypothetical protein
MHTLDAVPQDALVRSGDRLLTQISRALSAPAADRTSLRLAVHAFARATRDADTLPEHALIELKRAIREESASRASYRVANSVTDEVVRWFIEAYYGMGAARVS